MNNVGHIDWRLPSGYLSSIIETFPYELKLYHTRFSGIIKYQTDAIRIKVISYCVEV